jgi:hypothetical protein
MKQEPRNNIYAKNLKGEEKHISEVKKGRKGYYCLGCNGEMEARKGEIKSHYFAHVPTNITTQRECTYSDESYRHKLAKEILQRIKQIKVPALYKYSIQNENPRRIKDSWVIKADSVKIERQFYENANGEIQYGRNINFTTDTKKHLLIQPDVIFFNKDEEPILLIEVVATNEIDANKLSKIKRLGIDTVQVRIPKSSPEDIEKVFYKSGRTQWIFNNEKERTNYLSLSKGINEGILQPDKFQKKILNTDESFACRSSQIRNLIRGIGKPLESQQYQRVKQNLREELIRVKKNTESYQERLERLQTEYRKPIEERHRLEEETLERKEQEFNKANREFQEYTAKMEERYFRKRDDIKKSQREYEPKNSRDIKEIETKIKNVGGDRTSPNKRIATVRGRRKEVEEERRRIIQSEEKQQRIFGDLEKAEKELRKETVRFEEQFKEQFEQEIDDRRKELIEKYRNLEIQIKQEFKELGREAVNAVKSRDSHGNSRINRRIRETISCKKLLLSIAEEQDSIKRFRAIKQILDEKSYKDWL